MISALTSSAPPRPRRPVARPPAIAEPAAPSAPAPSAPATSGPAQNAKAETAMSETRPRICLAPPPAIAPERIGDEANVGARADAPAPPIPAQHGLAVDLEDGRQALAELPAIPAIARRPAGAAQERRHGLPRPRLGARDLEARHNEMPDDRRPTPGAALAARA